MQRVSFCRDDGRALSSDRGGGLQHVEEVGAVWETGEGGIKNMSIYDRCWERAEAVMPSEDLIFLLDRVLEVMSALVLEARQRISPGLLFSFFIPLSISAHT